MQTAIDDVLVIERDHNASLNILEQAVGRHGCVIPQAPAL